jgi:hypothetical protein
MLATTHLEWTVVIAAERCCPITPPINQTQMLSGCENSFDKNVIPYI